LTGDCSPGLIVVAVNRSFYYSKQEAIKRPILSVASFFILDVTPLYTSNVKETL